MFRLLVFWILAGCFLSGVMAEDRVVIHYQLKNTTLCLRVEKQAPSPFTGGKWRTAGKVIASPERINPYYKERVDFNPQNLSLCMKALTDNDTGIYEVSFTDNNFNDISERHSVIVQGTVPTPVITVSGPSSNLSAGPCKITVNCSIQDNWVWSVCDEESCSSSHRSFSKVNITISTDRRTVVCTGNNHVSSSNVSENLATTCFSKSNPEHKEPSQRPFELIVVIVAVLMSVFLCACIVILAKKRCSKAHNRHPEPTSNAQVIPSQLNESPPEPRLSTSSSQGEASYENVDPTQPSLTSSPRESMPNQEVDTVYSLLQAKDLPDSARKSDSREDTKGHKRIQEASTSQLVTVDAAEQPREINTVYSVLHKPQKVKSQHHQQDKEDFQRDAHDG